MNETKMTSKDWKAQVKAQAIHLLIWTITWVATVGLALYGSEFLWNSRLLTIGVILLNAAAGLGMITANIRHINLMDEMMRKIQLQAMGLALGTGIVGGLSYALLDVTDIISSDAKIAYIVILMTIIYAVTLIINHRRYK